MSDRTDTIPGGGNAWSAEQWHEVTKGDSLWKIAERYYGDGSLYPKIFERTATSSRTPTGSRLASGCASREPTVAYRRSTPTRPEGAMMRVVKTMLWTVMVSLALAAACASEKAPAEQALKTAEAAIGEIRGEAAKWVPDQARALDATLASLKDKFGKGEYKAVLVEAPALAGRAREVAAAASAKKAELTKTWDEMSVGLPKIVDAVKSRGDILSKSKKLPANVTKEKFEAAKAGLAEATKGWEDATAAYKGGNVADAVARADTVKRKTVEALEALGMPVPPAARS